MSRYGLELDEIAWSEPVKEPRVVSLGLSCLGLGFFGVSGLGLMSRWKSDVFGVSMYAGTPIR